MADGTSQNDQVNSNNSVDWVHSTPNQVATLAGVRIEDRLKLLKAKLATVLKMKKVRGTKQLINNWAKQLAAEIAIFEKANRALVLLQVGSSIYQDGYIDGNWTKPALACGLAALTYVLPEVGIPLSLIDAFYLGGLIQLGSDLKSEFNKFNPRPLINAIQTRGFSLYVK